MTLVEVMIGASLGAMVLAGVLAMFLFLGRSGANISNYAEMESEARVGLELFAQDTRQASDLSWNSAESITLVVNGAPVTYTYLADEGVFVRTAAAGPSTLIAGITSFRLAGYMITGAGVDLTDLGTAAKRDAASGVTKQVQIYLRASRTSATVTTATNTVLSARYILRNKRVTA